VRLLDNGDQKLQALEEAILAARHHVHLEYYIWEPDHVGARFRDLLAAAASRGVEVRVLCDDVGSPHLTSAFWKPLTDAGGEVLTFNPVRLSFASLNFANFRTHRKIAILDGHVGFLGGINLHDPASATRSGKDAWRDEHVRIDGEPVRKLQRLFLENWTYAGGSFLMLAKAVERYFPAAKDAAGKLPVQILASGPDDEAAPLHAFFLAALATARSRAWIETPYLIPDESLESALRVAQLRGVDVQVIVPRDGDSRLVTAASHTYCESLGRAGIVIFEYGPPMLHAKTLVIDETMAMVGTANLDNRSFRLNFEVAAAFYDPAVIAQLALRFERDRAVSRPFPVRKRHPRLTVILESIARLTSPVL
jgi:cardiolipin synthase